MIAGLDTGTLTLDWCREYLGREVPRRDPAISSFDVIGISKFPRGVSRETWMVEAIRNDVDGSRRPYPLIVRRDQEFGSIDDSALRFEYGIYDRLAKTDVPVARPLWFGDESDDPAGRLHYIREQVEGHWDIPGFREPGPAGDELRIEASQEYLRAMAKVHTIDWRALGFDSWLEPPNSLASCALDALTRDRDRIDIDEWRRHPVLAEAFHALAATAPTDTPVISLCKGTSGLGEEVWRDGRIVAMSDWESCSLGDPASDFARCQEMIPDIVGDDGTPRWGWPQAMEYYRSVSGIPVSAERIGWYTHLYGFSMFRYAQSCMRAMRGEPGLVRLAWTATDVLMWAQVRLAAPTAIRPLPIASRG